ncbi:MAG TPA: TetR family transcriptional regulator [Nocardioidaceae bacterium]|nr:TetR family transcriptional regulator [Nocardioidaceae bacterium]
MTSEPAARWTRLGADERMQQILDSAVRLFTERAYADVSTTEVAEASGVTRGLVYHYFGTKHDLYLEVLRKITFVPPMETLSVRAWSREERIAAAVDLFMETVERIGPSWALVTMSGGMTSDPEVRRVLDEADDLAAERVLHLVGFEGSEKQREVAMAGVRAFGGMAKALVREMHERQSLDLEQVRALLIRNLTATLDASS